MNYIDKINELKNIIRERLTPYINNDYIFIGLPYYDNIGDILIWEGTEQFLKDIPYKCLMKSSIETFDNPELSPETIILLQGGGNFGDIWFEHQDFRLKVIQKYKKNPIVILPQSVYYIDKEICDKECKIIKEHSNLTIFVRDFASYNLLNSYSLNAYLVPDMAFFLAIGNDEKKYKIVLQKDLLLLRGDKELSQYDFANWLDNSDMSEVHDWPSYEHRIWFLQIMYTIKKSLFRKIGLTDLWAQYYFKHKMIDVGIKFLCQYNTIYTTRLHGAILSVLLGKNIVLFDNSYGKNSGFYDTWLKDLDSIKMIRKC